MKYSIEFKNTDIELPNYTLDIAEALEKAEEIGYPVYGSDHS